MHITLIGTGLMGFPMAKNLLQAGHSLRVWNRSADKAKPLTNFGADCCEDLGEALSKAQLIISMVSDGSVLASILADENVRQNLNAGAMWVDMSSTKPSEARQAAAALKALRLSFADAPVSGGTKGAEAGTLAIMVGAAIQDFAQAREALSAMGRPVHVGPVGAGQLAKLANQLIVAVTIGAVAEATLLLERGGAAPSAVRDALKGGFADSTILQQHGQRMELRDFEPGGLSALQLKDLKNIQEQAQGLGLALPICDHMADRFAHYVHGMDGGGRDHSGLFEELLAHNVPAS